MKKLLIASALFLSANYLNAAPGKGGYLGHRIIFGLEGAYSPFYSSFGDFFTKYNLQYGANLNVITGRHTQVGFHYNMYSLGNNQLYNSALHESDRVKGQEFGLNLRTFRKKRGGLAPIGKFFDLGLSYSINKYTPGAGNPSLQVLDAEDMTMSSDQLMAHIGFGTQMIFWNRVVGNTGIRMGAPIYEVNSHIGSASLDPDKSYGSFLMERTFKKEIFSVFFGVGILL